MFIKMSKTERNYDVTHNELIKLKNFENLTEEESEKLRFLLKELSLILFECFQNSEIINYDNHQNINL
jgi:hypothetical protein